MANKNNIGQSSSLDPFTTKALASNDYNELKFESKKVDTVVRFLISKLVFTSEELTLLESTALFLSYEQMVIKVAKDKIYKQKYGYDIFLIRHIIQSLKDLVESPPDARFAFMEEYRSLFHRNTHFSRRYYFAIKGQMKRSYNLFIQRRFVKKFPAKAFIGKGYRDKGSAKNVSLDGSPSWQEVAVDEINRNSPEFYKQDISEKIEWEFSNLISHSAQIFQYTGKANKKVVQSLKSVILDV